MIEDFTSTKGVKGIDIGKQIRGQKPTTEARAINYQNSQRRAPLKERVLKPGEPQLIWTQVFDLKNIRRFVSRGHVAYYENPQYNTRLARREDWKNAKR